MSDDTKNWATADNPRTSDTSDRAQTGALVSQKLRTIRHASWIAIAILCTAVSGVVGWQLATQYLLGPARQTGQVLVKSEFSLIDHNGQRVTQNDFAGRWQLVFFGFTYCPDVCPTTLAAMGQVLDELGDKASKVAVLFITVDPKRDTPNILKEYVTAIHPKLVGLTGTPEEIDKAARSFRIYYAKAKKEDAPDGYFMNHSGFIYLMTPAGKYEAVFTEKRNSPAQIAAEIKKRL